MNRIKRFFFFINTFPCLTHNTNIIWVLYCYWTISRVSDFSANAFGVLSGGYAGYTYVSHDYCVWPTFSLVSSVKILGGSGTESNPFRIEL